MANACEVFGDLVPNIYIDQVFLEEALVDTNNDGTLDQQTPKINVNLKVLDQLDDNGTYALLGDALEYQGVNFKDFIKVHCVLITSEDLAEEFLLNFEDDNYNSPIDYFSYPTTTAAGDLFNTTKSLQDITWSSYINQAGVTELISSFTFDLAAGSALEYLRVVCWVELDTKSLGQNFGVDFPNEYKNILSRYQDQIVVKNSIITSEMTIFVTEDGDLWNGPLHVHYGSGTEPTRSYMEGRSHSVEPHGYLAKATILIRNVQDFRIRDEIEILIADFSKAIENHYLFPGQKEILDPLIVNESYFSEMFVTKDRNRNVRFFFTFDYGKFVFKNSKYAKIIEMMGEDIKQQILNNSQIVKFMVRRRQVKKQPALNRLGSPIQNFPINDAAVEAPVILSLDDSNLSEINLILSEQTTTSDSLLRHFTGIDKSAKDESDGIFQYFVEVEVLDGFVPTIKEAYTQLINAASEYDNYIALTQIPDMYDSLSRKFTTQGIDELNAWNVSYTMGTDENNLPTMIAKLTLQDIVRAYLNALGIFVDLTTPIEPTSSVSKNDYFYDKINTMLLPQTGGIDGVLMFDKLLNTLSSQIMQIMSVGHSGGGVEDTLENQRSDVPALFKLQTSETREYFENTIGSRFLNESYIDNVSNVNISGYPGLTLYTQTQLAYAIPLEQNFNPEAPENQTTEEALGAFGITFEIHPVKVGTFGSKMMQVSAADYLSAGQGATAPSVSSSVTNLSAQDLQIPDLPINSVNTDAAFAPFVASLSELSPSGVLTREATEEQLQTAIDVLVGFVLPSNITTTMWTPWSGTQTFVTPTGFSSMLRAARFERKTLADLSVNAATNSYFLCKQTKRSDLEVVDSYFLVNPTVSSTFVELPEITITQDQEGVPDPYSATQQVPELETPLVQEQIDRTYMAPSVQRAIEQAQQQASSAAVQAAAAQGYVTQRSPAVAAVRETVQTPIVQRQSVSTQAMEQVGRQLNLTRLKGVY